MSSDLMLWTLSPDDLAIMRDPNRIADAVVGSWERWDGAVPRWQSSQEWRGLDWFLRANRDSGAEEFTLRPFVAIRYPDWYSRSRGYVGFNTPLIVNLICERIQTLTANDIVDEVTHVPDDLSWFGLNGPDASADFEVGRERLREFGDLILSELRSFYCEASLAGSAVGLILE